MLPIVGNFLFSRLLSPPLPITAPPSSIILPLKCPVTSVQLRVALSSSSTAAVTEWHHFYCLSNTCMSLFLTVAYAKSEHSGSQNPKRVLPAPHQERRGCRAPFLPSSCLLSLLWPALGFNPFFQLTESWQQTSMKAYSDKHYASAREDLPNKMEKAVPSRPYTLEEEVNFKQIRKQITVGVISVMKETSRIRWQKLGAVVPIRTRSGKVSAEVPCKLKLEGDTCSKMWARGKAPRK